MTSTWFTTVYFSWFNVFHCHERVFHDYEAHCFIMIQGLSWSWNKLFYPGSTCIKVFHNHNTNCFISDSSRFHMFHDCFITLIHAVSCRFILFHHCFTSGNGHVSCQFNRFHHCFNAVSPMGTNLKWYLSHCFTFIPKCWDKIYRSCHRYVKNNEQGYVNPGKNLHSHETNSNFYIKF